MGLGPLAAIYQARFNRYLHARGVKDTSGSRVWAFLGDGETDEPEAMAALALAAREGLDNLTFVINCNLQRLSYDPAFAYEIAVIVREGLRRMYGTRSEDVFYYLTVYNEPKQQPVMPTGPGSRRGSCGACTGSGGRSRATGGRGSSCWLPAQPSTGYWRPRNCSAPGGESRPTCGR